MSIHIQHRRSLVVGSSRTRSIAALAIIALGALSACGLSDAPALELADEAAALAEAQPSPGAPGIGDVLFPNLGNGGYQVEHYQLDLRYATAEPSQPIDGTVTIRARATQALSRFDLDFSGDAVGAVTVDGCAAAYSWDGEELVITPAHPLHRGQHFAVTVSHFASSPAVPDPSDFLGAPFFSTPDGTAWAGQPHNAHRIFPSNDHPRDKATFSFKIDVPAGTTAVANGELVAQHTAGGRTIWQYQEHEPMATELAQVAVGALTVTSRGRHDGVLVRDVTPTRLTADLEPKMAVEIAQLDSLRALLGDYPFRTYGSLVVDASLGFALETQTLSLYDTFLFGLPESTLNPILVHELAHQWFGNSVAPAQWSDVWQNEGHATWYELTSDSDPDSAEFVQFMQLVYSFSDILRNAFGPVAAPLSGDPIELFNTNVYFGGALTLYALRQEIGDTAFKNVERAWVTQYRGRSASTRDFIALASQVSGQDVSAFLEAWLFGTTTPAMPGHPDWTVRPVNAQLAGADRASAAQLPLSLRPLLRY